MANKPRIRFKGFTEDWEQRKLNDFGIATGGTSLESEFVDGGNYKVISIGSYSEESVYNDQGLRVNKSDKTKSRILNKNDLTMILNDKTASGNIIGRVLLIDQDNTYVYNQRTERIEVDRKNFLPIFLYHMLNAPEQRKYIVKASQGNTQIYVNWSAISNINYMIPQLLIEQEKIAYLFSLINKDITLHQCKLEKLKLTKKALLQKLFPKNGKHIPEIRFKGFTDTWEQRKLGDIATFSKGNGYSKSDLAPSGNPIILYGRLYTNYETTISNVDTFVELKDKSVLSQGGEVIVPASGETAEDISRASVVKNQGIIIGGDLNVIKANHLLDPTFLALTISNGGQQKELSKRAQGKLVVHLHNSDLQEVNLTFPLLNEQKEISTLFEKMDNIITLHQRKLERLQEVKKGLLQKMFV